MSRIDKHLTTLHQGYIVINLACGYVYGLLHGIAVTVITATIGVIIGAIVGHSAGAHAPECAPICDGETGKVVVKSSDSEMVTRMCANAVAVSILFP